MSVYKIRSDKARYMTFTIDLEEIFAKMGEEFEFDFPTLGMSVSSKWKAPESGSFYQPEEFPGAEKMPELTDWQQGDLVLSHKAHDALAEVLNPYGEFLPVKCDGETFYVFNVLNIVDDNVVDGEWSEQDLDQGVFMGVKKLAFNEDKLGDALIFKTRFDQLRSVYCQDEFKTLVEKAGLEGLLFERDLAAF